MNFFDKSKTPIYPDINDQPREATAELPSNGADLVHKVNKLVDVLDQVVVPTWGNTAIYVNGTTGSDSNDGLTKDTPLLTFEALLNLAKTKQVDDNLTFFLTDISLNIIDLDEIIIWKNGKLSIVRYSGYVTIDSNTENNGNLFLNASDDYQIEIRRIVFRCKETLNIRYLKNLRINNCDFTSHNDFVGTLALLRYIESINLDGCYFSGDSISQASENLLSIKDCIRAKLTYCEFSESTNKPIIVDNSNITFSEENNFDEAILNSTQNIALFRNSMITTSVYDNFVASNTELDNAYILNSQNPNVLDRVISIYVASLDNQTIPIAAQFNTNSSVKKLKITTSSENVSFDLLVNGNVLSKLEDNPKSKTYDLKDISNRISLDGSNNIIELVSTGTALNVLIELTIIEF